MTMITLGALCFRESTSETEGEKKREVSWKNINLRFCQVILVQFSHVPKKKKKRAAASLSFATGSIWRSKG